MPSSLEITIPSAQVTQGPKPFTQYNISLRLPLRSFTILKRYSEFLALHTSLQSQANGTPPAPLPPKSWFTRTLNNPALTESRRKGLETYLQAINKDADSRWRDTPAWHTFLNLPSNSANGKSNAASTLRANVTTASATTDPVVWLDVHRELKTQLQSAREHIMQRDTATTPQSQHEEGAAAKSALVRAGTLISTLASGLDKKGEEWGSERLGEGEVRRRRDLVSSARSEKENLEGLMTTMAKKAEIDQVVREKKALVGEKQSNGNGRHGVGKGRVLGKETARTRELDNTGLVQLQKDMMEEQDEDVRVLGQAIARQKELAAQINEELVIQDTMLGMLDEDVTRVDNKVAIARKRVAKIR